MLIYARGTAGTIVSDLPSNYPPAECIGANRVETVRVTSGMKSAAGTRAHRLILELCGQSRQPPQDALQACVHQPAQLLVSPRDAAQHSRQSTLLRHRRVRRRAPTRRLRWVWVVRVRARRVRDRLRCVRGKQRQRLRVRVVRGSEDASDAWWTMNCGASCSNSLSRMLHESMLSLIAAAGQEFTSFQSVALAPQ